MNILFICTGNTCRSVIAEELAKKYFSGHEDIKIKSCGIASSPDFSTPEIVRKLLKKENIDFKNHISTPVTKKLVDESDIIFVMDKNHLEYIGYNFSRAEKKTYLLKSYVKNDPDEINRGHPEHIRFAQCKLREGSPFLSDMNIDDPIGGPEEVYTKCFYEIKECIIKLVDKIDPPKAGHPDPNSGKGLVL